MKITSHPLRRVAFIAAKCAVVALVIWGVHRTINAAFADLEEHAWSPSELNVGWLIASGVVYLASLFPSAWFWHRILTTLGQRPSLGESMRAYYVGHLGKYVPGKALVVVMRATLVHSRRTGVAVAAAAVFFETLTMMAAGSFVSGALLAFWFRHQTWLMLVALAMMLVSGVPTLPPVFRYVVRFVARRKGDPAAFEQLTRLGYGTLALGWIGMSLGWFLNGLSLYMVVGACGFSITPEAMERYILCTIAGAMSVVVGFISFIPGGAIVREAVLMFLLPPRFGQLAAVVSAIMARLVSIVAELVISAILYFTGPSPVERSNAT